MRVRSLGAFIDMRKDAELVFVVFVNHLARRHVVRPEIFSNKVAVGADLGDKLPDFFAPGRTWVLVHCGAAVSSELFKRVGHIRFPSCLCSLNQK